jgi:hypothetical protein
MSPSQGESAVLRQLFPFDIAGIQRLFGAVQPAGEAAARLETAVRVDSSARVTFSAAPGALVVGGPGRATCLMDCFIPIVGSTLNSVKLRLNTSAATWSCAAWSCGTASSACKPIRSPAKPKATKAAPARRSPFTGFSAAPGCKRRFASASNSRSARISPGSTALPSSNRCRRNCSRRNS